jgi:hypothetical protein
VKTLGSELFFNLSYDSISRLLWQGIFSILKEDCWKLPSFKIFPAFLYSPNHCSKARSYQELLLYRKNANA